MSTTDSQADEEGFMLTTTGPIQYDGDSAAKRDCVEEYEEVKTLNATPQSDKDPEEVPTSDYYQNILNHDQKLVLTQQARSAYSFAGSVVVKDRAIMHNGDRYDQQYNYINDSTQVFSGLRRLAGTDSIDEQQRFILEQKFRYESGRAGQMLLQLSSNVPDRYSPYCTVKHPAIRSKLATIASRFQFLDRGFAEYFQSVMPSFDQKYITARVADARSAIAKSQTQSHSGDTVPDDTVVLGDLGHFCERVIERWDTAPADEKKRAVYTVTTATPDDLMRYLQDSLEAPYWQLMLDCFLQERRNRPNLSGKVVLQALNSTKVSVKEWTRLVHADANYANEDIGPILDGIETRIRILDSAWDEETSEHDLLDMLTEHATRRSLDDVKVASTAYAQPTMQAKQQKSVWTISLAILFIVGSIVPFAEGFSISRHSTEIGSTSDADFFYLIQNSVMAVLGSLVMITDLMSESWNSPAYNMMWTFTALGIICAAVSIAVYPVCNTAWSSMISYFGSILSLAAVLVMTQASAKPAPITTEAKKNQ